GQDFRERCRNKGVWPVGGDIEMEHRRAQEIERLFEGSAVEKKRAARFLALVARPIGFEPVWTPFPGCKADGLRRTDRQAPFVVVRYFGKATRAKCELERLAIFDGPAFLRDPASGPLLVVPLRRHGLLNPGPERRLVHDAGLDSLQPFVPPAQALLQEADAR